MRTYRGQINLKLKALSTDNTYLYYQKKIPYDIQAENKKDRDFIISSIVRQAQVEPEMESEVLQVEVIQKNIIHYGQLNTASINQIRMRLYTAPQINKYTKHDWDTKNGTCVLDYLIYRYKNVKGMIKKMKKETLIDILDPSEEDDILNKGITINHIKNFCSYFNITLYAIDDFGHLIDYQPRISKGHKYPVLCFRISNNHIYPIEDEKKIRSIYAKQVQHNVKSDVFKEEKSIETTTKNIQYVDDIQSQFNYHLYVKNIIPTSVYIDSEHNIVQYEIDDINYCYNPYHKEIEHSSSLFNIPYKNQQIGTHSLELAKQLLIELPYSNHSIPVLQTLIKAKKNRTHHGFIDCIPSASSELQAYDINKCYRYALHNPIEPFIILSFKDDWKKYKKSKTIPLGLFNVETEDTTLFKGNNIYSTSMIKHAIKHKIPFKITHQLLASKKVHKSFFRPYIDTIVKTFGETPFTKHLINSFTGQLGRHENKKSKCAINKDLQQVLLHFIKNPNNTFCLDLSNDVPNLFEPHPYYTEDNTYYYEDDIHKENPYNYYDNPYNSSYYFYGNDTTTYFTSSMLPIYIQLLDDANILLYNLQQEIIKSGGTPVARKVDCVVAINSTYNPPISSLWGKYRKCEPPVIRSLQFPSDFQFKLKNWIKNPKIKSSNHIQHIINTYLTHNKSFLIAGKAGTGKSYLKEKIIEYLTKNNLKPFKLAPTNIVAINMLGSTIHAGAIISKDNKISKKRLTDIKKRYDYIIVEEISMITTELWKILETIKLYTNIPFILIGDYRQLPPVEDDPIDYINHSSVKYIADYNFVELTELQRYSEELAQVADDVYDDKQIDINNYPEHSHTPINLCYYNTTRKKINTLYNIIPSDEPYIKLKKIKSEKYSQDIYLHPNLPVIAYKTYRLEDYSIYFANGERFIVSYFNEDIVSLYNERLDENLKPSLYTIEIPLEEFQNYFLLNYCTTVHKAQGTTITQPYNIYDWDKMSNRMKYTAITRAKELDLIGISSSCNIPSAVEVSCV